MNEKDSPEFYLKHYGVVGMKWGQFKRSMGRQEKKLYKSMDKEGKKNYKRMTMANSERLMNDVMMTKFNPGAVRGEKGKVHMQFESGAKTRVKYDSTLKNILSGQFTDEAKAKKVDKVIEKLAGVKLSELDDKSLEAARFNVKNYKDFKIKTTAPNGKAIGYNRKLAEAELKKKQQTADFNSDKVVIKDDGDPKWKNFANRRY